MLVLTEVEDLAIGIVAGRGAQKGFSRERSDARL